MNVLNEDDVRCYAPEGTILLLIEEYAAMECQEIEDMGYAGVLIILIG